VLRSRLNPDDARAILGNIVMGDDDAANGAEEVDDNVRGHSRLLEGWRKARSIIRLHGSFEMTARLDADELTRAFDRDPKLANARGWASEQARYPGSSSTGSPRAKPSSQSPSPGTRLELSTRAQRSWNSISTSAFGRPARSRHRGARTNG
jgi:hypothetical protein